LGDIGVEIDKRIWNNRFLKPPLGVPIAIGMGVKNKGKKAKGKNKNV